MTLHLKGWPPERGPIIMMAKQGGTAEHHGCSFVPDEAGNRLSLEEAIMIWQSLRVRCTFIFPRRAHCPMAVTFTLKTSARYGSKAGGNRGGGLPALHAIPSEQSWIH